MEHPFQSGPMPHDSCSPSHALIWSRVSLLLTAVTLTGCQDTTGPSSPEANPSLAEGSAEALTFRQLSAGQWHTCGVTTDNRAYCWGDNSTGQLGNGTLEDRARPMPVAGGLRFILVSAGATYSCGVTSSNRAYCWGKNDRGQLGDGTTTQRLSPTAVGGGRIFRQVRAGHFHTCGVTPLDLAFCWGANSDGQLGDGTKVRRLLPVRVRGGLTFRRVFTSGLHTCGTTLDSRAYCWGKNEDGQLGDGTTIPRLIPVRVAGGHRFRDVVVGAARDASWKSVSCGVTTGDRAYCWGDNVFGALGDGTTTSRSAPVAVSGGLAFSSVSEGGVHTCGVTTGNRAYCWGSNGNWQLGDGTGSQDGHLTPNAVAGDVQFRAITAGLFHTCAITPQNVAYCWGNNFKGQLGVGYFDGTPFRPHASPEQVLRFPE
jgi:alpha-tubulin suppressor-like RCC1 family protein